MFPTECHKKVALDGLYGPIQFLFYFDAYDFPHLVFCDTVRDLAITLDQELNFSAHVNQLTRGCYYQHRQLRTVSRSLSHGAAATFCYHAFVTSRLDHCCSVLVGLPLTLTARIDRVLNSV